MKISNDMGFKLNISFQKKESTDQQADGESTVSSNSEGKTTITGFGFQTKSQSNSQAQGVVDLYSLEADTAKGYAARTLAGKKAENEVNNLGGQKVADQEKSRLKKERKELEEKIAKQIEEKAQARVQEETARQSRQTDTQSTVDNTQAVNATQNTANVHVETSAQQTTTNDSPTQKTTSQSNSSGSAQEHIDIEV